MKGRYPDLNITLLSTLEAILLTTALSTDAFVASFAYGSNEIKIPVRSVIIINIICTTTLTISLFLGNVIRPMLQPHITNIICFLILMALGIVKLFDSSIKAYIRRKKDRITKIKFSLFRLNFVLTVYADPEKADFDASRTLSSYEAITLAIALSLDGIAVGFGAALTSVNHIEIIFFSFLLGIFAVKLGCCIGHKVVQKLSIDLSWLSGVLLMILATLKIIN